MRMPGSGLLSALMRVHDRLSLLAMDSEIGYLSAVQVRLSLSLLAGGSARIALGLT